MKTKIRNSNSKSQADKKLIYCPTLGHSIKYAELLAEAKRISDELHKAKQEGFLKSTDESGAFKLASVLACFKGTIEEVHVPLKEEDITNQWDQIRGALSGKGA